VQRGRRLDGYRPGVGIAYVTNNVATRDVPYHDSFAGLMQPGHHRTVDARRSSNLTAVRESRCLNAVFGTIRHADVTCVVIVYLPSAVGTVVSAR
jgi:hypothetical protein